MLYYQKSEICYSSRSGTRDFLSFESSTRGTSGWTGSDRLLLQEWRYLIRSQVRLVSSKRLDSSVSSLSRVDFNDFRRTHTYTHLSFPHVHFYSLDTSERFLDIVLGGTQVPTPTQRVQAPFWNSELVSHRRCSHSDLVSLVQREVGSVISLLNTCGSVSWLYGLSEV